MNQSFTPPLLDLLARSWQRPGPVEDVAFDAAGMAMLVRGADGSLALAAVADGEPARGRMRMEGDSGRMTIRPRRRALPPLVEPDLTAPEAAAVAVLPRGGLAVGGADGTVFQLTPRGQRVPLRPPGEGPLQALVADARGRLALAVGGRVLLRDGDAETAVLETRAERLAFALDGTLVASDGTGIWLAGAEGTPRRHPVPSAAGPLALSGRWIAGACAGKGIWLLDRDSGRLAQLPGFPAASRSVLLRAEDTLVASGAFRLAAWRLERPPFDGDHGGALSTGAVMAATVTVAAVHPARDLVAYARTGGMLVLARLGRPDELVLLPGGDEIGALAFSPDGRHLGLGTHAGTAALVELPDMIFK